MLITMGVQDDLALEDPIDIGEVKEREGCPCQGDTDHDPEG